MHSFQTFFVFVITKMAYLPVGLFAGDLSADISNC